MMGVHTTMGLIVFRQCDLEAMWDEMAREHGYRDYLDAQGLTESDGDEPGQESE